METFLQNFKLELLGNVLLSSYLAWVIWSIIGQVLATLIRNHLTTLKSYPVNVVQLVTGLLLVLVFIRFGLELTNFVPTAFGAFIIGLGGNELALAFLKKYLNKKKEESSILDSVKIAGDSNPDIGGGGIKNPPPTKP